MVLRAAFVALLMSAAAQPYSVLTHEAIIDAAWDDALKPLLLSRYPNATAEELRKAHAFAYGGAIVADCGYYPFGSRFFSDLTHYIRSGDFIRNTVAEASNLNEFAFALGAIAHYAADHSGHLIAVNRSVALMYPKLRRKYGDTVTYEQNPAAHLKVELGFDVAQVTKGNYAPDAYREFVGFDVSKELLERAFQKTYALKLDDVFAGLDLALGTFRFAVSNVIPQVTKIAWASRKKDIIAAKPGITRDKFVYNLSRSSFEKTWGRTYKRPGWFARFLGCLLRILPKVGPLGAFSFRAPTAEAEKLFMDSFNQTLTRYKALLSGVRDTSVPAIPNENFDTGQPAKFGNYQLADKAYEKLLDELARKDFAGVDTDLRKSLLDHAKGAKAVDGKIGANLRLLEQMNAQ
jgi:hypothetical protein